jgi:hypothetical protein
LSARATTVAAAITSPVTMHLQSSPTKVSSQA